MENVTFSTKMTVKSMFLFLIQHSYRGSALIINFLITGGSLYLFFTGLSEHDTIRSIALLFMASLFSVIYPVQLFLRARRQVKKNPVFREPLIYTLTEEGITMKQGEVEQSFLWGDIFQVREKKSMIAVYTSRVYACIWPAADLIGKEKEIKEMLSKHLSKKVYKKKTEED